MQMALGVILVVGNHNLFQSRMYQGLGLSGLLRLCELG
jgi:hypothetical protein